MPALPEPRGPAMASRPHWPLVAVRRVDTGSGAWAVRIDVWVAK